MHSGRRPDSFNTMRSTRLPLLAVLLAVFCSCHNGNQNNTTETNISITPEAGTSFKSGDAVPIKVGVPQDMKADSIVILLDSNRITSSKESLIFNIKTDTLPLGTKTITARVYTAGKSQEVSTNIVLLAAKAPDVLTFQVQKVFPHDTSSYTEGLVYQDGYLYESGGGYGVSTDGEPVDGPSSLRKVDITTGKVLQKTMLDPKVFGEGISIVGDKIIQLTWKEKKGYVYDKNTLKLLNTFNNNVGIEGWGMCFDGKRLYMDDSSNRIWFLNKDTYQSAGYIDVYDNQGPVQQINELEYIDGKLYANIYQTDYIIVIDPKTGAVLQKIDLTSLYPKDQRNPQADVLNGIAWDAQGKRLFVTGKKWNKLFQIGIVKASTPAAK